MAIFNGKTIKGSIGPVSFTQKGNISIIRSKPGKGGVKQSPATKVKASLFGKIISPLSKLIRQAFAEIHLGYYDGAMVNRMNGAISTLVNQHVNEEGNFTFNEDSFNRLNGFDFNLLSPLNKSFLILPKVTLRHDTLHLAIPQFEVSKNLRFPHKATNCQMNMQLVLFSIQTGHWQIQAPINLPILKSQSIQTAAKWSFQIPEGCLAVLGATITFTKSNSQNILNDKSFHPAAVLAAFYYEGESLTNFDQSWMLFGVKLGKG